MKTKRKSTSTTTESNDVIKLIVFDDKAGLDSVDILKLTGATHARVLDSPTGETNQLAHALDDAFAYLEDDYAGNWQVWEVSSDASSQKARRARGFKRTLLIPRNRVGALTWNTTILISIEEARDNLRSLQVMTRRTVGHAEAEGFPTQVFKDDLLALNGIYKRFGRQTQRALVQSIRDLLSEQW